MKLALVLVAAAGCAPHHTDPFVPADAKGDVPILLANNTKEDVCEFAARAHATEKGENWLGAHRLAPGETLMFLVRADWYAAGFTSCGGAHSSFVDHLAISGPTYLSYNATPTKAPPGYALAELPPQATKFVEKPPEPPPQAGAADSRTPGQPDCQPVGSRICN